MASAVICLAICRKFNFLKYILDNLVRNVDSSSKFYMYPRFLQLMIHSQVSDLSSHTTKYSSPALTQKVFANMRRVGNRFSGVETLLFEGMLVTQQAAADNVPADDVANVADDDVDDVPAADAEPTPTSPPPTIPTPPQEQPSTSQVAPTPPPLLIAPPSSPPQQQQPSQHTTISMDLLHTLLETWGIIADLDADKDVISEEVVAAKDAEVLSMQDDEPEPAELKEVIEVVTTAKLMTKVVTALGGSITTAKLMTKVVTAAATIAAPSAARRRKGVVIRDPEETSTPSTIVHSEPKSKDKGKGIMVKEKGKQDNVVLRYQALKRKLQTKAQARKNMMVYLKNMVGFKMDYFKGMSYDDIRPIFEKYFNSNVAILEKSIEELEEEESRALKRKTESSEEKAVKKQKLDEEVPVIDYEIHTKNNKPYYKIIRADGSHRLFLSLLRNFDREDLEELWQIVQERFASSKPKNFSDDFLLTTLKAMFEKPDMLNNVRLDVEDESEVSLELLRFIRRQQQEGYRPEFGVDAVEDFKEYTLRDYYCWLKTYKCWCRLMLLDDAADLKLRLLEQSVAAGIR
nr:hypothetical protein [Tanacetum cinerariifolium]